VYTQCSKCETVFKLSAEVLRAASGQVRCGKCGEVFNALARLAENSNAFATGESSLDLETRADQILGSVSVLKVAHAVAKDHEEYAPPGVEIAQLRVLDWSPDDSLDHEDTDVGDLPGPSAGSAAAGAPQSPDALDDRSMEFTLPPGELDRIFVESKRRARPSEPQAAVPDTPIEPRTDAEAASKDEPAPRPAAPSPELLPHPESMGAVTPPASQRVSGFEVPDDVRRDMLEGFEQHIAPANAIHNSRRRNTRRAFILWITAAVGSALLLVAQIAHQNRAWMVAHSHGPFGGGIRALYGALGNPLPQPANLSSYQLRQWGVTGDPDANGTLRVRASILNTAAQLQPYPLLRVNLADRFGKSIGRRDFEAAEYLGKPTARLLAPGERADATLEILDPGKNAEGFDIDVCLRGADQRIACQSDAAPQPKQ
jgi:predicted Zn finger-like uncharacterized protein